MAIPLISETPGCSARVTRWARCSLVTHQLGFEIRLITTDLLRSQVCRSSDEVLAVHEQWKAAMIREGWQ